MVDPTLPRAGRLVRTAAGAVIPLAVVGAGTLTVAAPAGAASTVAAAPVAAPTVAASYRHGVVPTLGQGASADVTMGTGTFAVQSSWANDYNGGLGGCELAHPFVSSTTDIVTVTNPGNQSSTIETPASLQVAATDTASGQTLTYSATGLPAGLSISTTGPVSGSPTTATTATVVVTVTDPTPASGSISSSWSVIAVPHVIAVTNPGKQTSALHTQVTLQIKATGSAVFTWTT